MCVAVSNVAEGGNHTEFLHPHCWVGEDSTQPRDPKGLANLQLLDRAPTYKVKVFQAFKVAKAKRTAELRKLRAAKLAEVRAARKVAKADTTASPTTAATAADFAQTGGKRKVGELEQQEGRNTEGLDETLEDKENSAHNSQIDPNAPRRRVTLTNQLKPFGGNVHPAWNFGHQMQPIPSMSCLSDSMQRSFAMTEFILRQTIPAGKS